MYHGSTGTYIATAGYLGSTERKKASEYEPVLLVHHKSYSCSSDRVNLDLVTRVLCDFLTIKSILFLTFCH
eukprot:SAG11_NODE_31172_length_294_cov_0.774359_1_plen_70_part_01